ncbi:MAG: methionine--tRNA ligase [Pseudomonadota bacterium]|nr:methionine--tRNA ligase [Pseudomonadota bacterium]
MSNSKRKILITSALPYANGDLHLGYMLEAIQTDVWTRFQKAQGHEVTYVCADDAHGASIMLKAAELGKTEEEHIGEIWKRHKKDLEDFRIGIDHYHSTHSEENRARAGSIFKALESAGMITKKEKEQLFDPAKSMFLADRFVKGECPKCHALDQYGDNCEVCGTTYEPNDLINPVSVFSGATPEMKKVEQLYFDLPQKGEFLQTWLDSGSMPAPVANKLREWLKDGLRPWDISREAPYFGFEIPGYPGKYFYVWLDAPIGYMASFEAYCNTEEGKARNLSFDEYWQANSDAELHHVIGKDIINFHGLFWPAMLDVAGYRRPTNIMVHGYVTINGEKMSKSRGTFITARQYLDHFDPDLLRYYFATKLSPYIDDIDLNLEEFAQKMNSDLVGKVVNIASRCAKFINKNFDNKLAVLNDENQAHYNAALEKLPAIQEAFNNFELGKGCRLIMQIADEANRLIDELKPWVTMKEEGGAEITHQTCSLGVRLFRIVMTLLAPMTPSLAQRTAEFFNVAELKWEDLQATDEIEVATFKPLLGRVDIKKLQSSLLSPAEAAAKQKPSKSKSEKKMESKPEVKAEAPATEAVEAPKGNLKPEITIEDFMKLDLRIVKIVDAQPVEGADKLIQVTADIGEGVTKNIFAGMKSAYQPEDLIGRQVLALVNLKPRKMRFGMSEGMMLAAGPGGSDIFLLTPDEGAAAGMNVN